MNRRGVVAILAQQTAYGISVPAFELVMGVIFDEEIVLGVQFAHLVARFRVGCTVGKFHQTLE